MGVSEGVSHGVSPGPFGPRAPECQKGVPRVSKRYPDTPGTLSGHLFDTPESGARRAPETPRGTLSRTPPFSGTPCRTLSGRLRARRARKTLLAGRGFPKSRSKGPSAPARGYRFRCACSCMLGRCLVWGCDLVVFDLCHFDLLKRGCANPGGLGAR